MGMPHRDTLQWRMVLFTLNCRTEGPKTTSQKGRSPDSMHNRTSRTPRVSPDARCFQKSKNKDLAPP